MDTKRGLHSIYIVKHWLTPGIISLACSGYHLKHFLLLFLSLHLSPSSNVYFFLERKCYSCNVVKIERSTMYVNTGRKNLTNRQCMLNFQRDIS